MFVFSFRFGINIGPFSGEAASLGETLQKSLELAELEVVELLFQDDQCDPKQAISAYNFLKNKGVAIFYTACSGSTLALAPLAKEDGNLIVTAYAGSSEIRNTGDEVIRFVPDGLSIAEVISSELRRENPERTYGIFFEQQDYARSVAQVMQDKLSNQVSVYEGYLTSNVSFRLQLLKFSDVDEIIIIPVDDKSLATIYEELSELNLGKNIIGEVNVCDKSIKPQEYGLRGFCYKAQLHTEGFNVFMKKFVEVYGEEPQYPFYDSISYDVIKIIDKLVRVDYKEGLVPVLKDKLQGDVSGEVTDYSLSAEGEIVNVGEYLLKVEF